MATTPPRPSDNNSTSHEMETLPHSAAATAATSSGKLDLRLIPPNRDQVLYPIDSAYFASHPALAVEGNDPFEMTILQLKEQIMADWHSDWENRPTETGSIRLIYMGRVLADGDKIRETRMSMDSLNVIHIAIAPPPMTDEEADPENAKNAGHGAGSGSSPRSCCASCVIM